MVVQDRYVVLCFEELDEDLISTHYYLDAYDLASGEKFIDWRETPGLLVGGGDLALFAEEAEGDDFNAPGYLVGYRIEALK